MMVHRSGITDSLISQPDSAYPGIKLYTCGWLNDINLILNEYSMLNNPDDDAMPL